MKLTPFGKRVVAAAKKICAEEMGTTLRQQPSARP
jgi:hypothetical protein